MPCSRSTTCPRSMTEHPDNEPDRERVRHHAPPDGPHQSCMSHATAMTMVFKLVTTASRTWRRLSDTNQLPKVVYGVKFRDGIEATDEPATINATAAA